jgi:hypothetical protein
VYAAINSSYNCTCSVPNTAHHNISEFQVSSMVSLEFRGTHTTEHNSTQHNGVGKGWYGESRCGGYKSFKDISVIRVGVGGLLGVTVTSLLGSAAFSCDRVFRIIRATGTAATGLFGSLGQQEGRGIVRDSVSTRCVDKG